VPVSSGNASLCTAVTCPTFAWCRDFADIPGLCLGDACENYTRSLALSVVFIALASCGVICDLIDVAILATCPASAKRKTYINLVSAGLKISGFLVCLSGGIQDFTDAAFANKCFNAKGSKLIDNTRTSVANFLASAALTGIGSFGLAPMSMRWGGILVGLPYARVRYG